MYNAKRGGHAPGHLRDAFWEWIQAGMPDVLADPITDQSRSRRWLLGQLWNCTDIIGASGMQDLADVGVELRRRTYAAAVRLLSASRT
jgi:hypothetical protein